MKIFDGMLFFYSYSTWDSNFPKDGKESWLNIHQLTKVVGNATCLRFKMFRGIVNVLMEMLSALGAHNSEDFLVKKMDLQLWICSPPQDEWYVATKSRLAKGSN